MNWWVTLQLILDIRCEGAEKIHMAKARIQSWALANTVMNIEVP
jgi:hypothetical protein